MSRMRRLVILLLPLVFGLCCIFIIGNKLAKSTYFENLVMYGQPICSMDRHRFESEKCETCEADIMSRGVFFSKEVAMMSPYGDDYQLRFSDYYESYEQFQADYEACMVNAVGMFGVIVMLIVGYIVIHVYSKKKGGLKDERH